MSGAFGTFAHEPYAACRSGPVSSNVRAHNNQRTLMTNEIATVDSIPSTKLADFGREIDLFTRHIDAVGDVLVGVVYAIQEASKQAKQKLRQFEDENCVIGDESGERSVKIPNTHYKEWKRQMRRYEHYSLSRTLLPRSLLVTQISQYDAYLGRLLRLIFIRKPEILNSSEKKITFEALNEFASIEAAREYILEKEVETILRSSHSEQFKWMEKAFDLPLTKDLASWPVFIEITERRNLFVHTDGIISSQYITVCKLHKCNLDDSLKEGQRLGVPQLYFKAAHQCIYEIGVKLGHVLWRKIAPEERAKADSHFVKVTYELIESNRFELAIKLLDFACNDFKKFSDEGNQLTLIVNRAQAYKWIGDADRCKNIMRAIDWSAKSDQFRLADAVLAEDWERAANIMRRIGKEGAVDETDYRDWPLFKDFRKQEQFFAAYQDIFGTAFAEKSEIKKIDLKALPQPDEPDGNPGEAESGAP